MILNSGNVAASERESERTREGKHEFVREGGGEGGLGVKRGGEDS